MERKSRFMDITQINKVLRDTAIKDGLCDKWQKDWRRDWPAQKLLEKYKEGIDFCLANNYPSADFIEKNFSLEDRHKVGVFVNEKYSILNREGCSVIRGTSIITARFNATSNGELYVTDNATLKVFAHGHSFVIVQALGNATVEAIQHDSAKLIIIKHSPCTIKTSGNVKIDEELNYLK